MALSEEQQTDAVFKSVRSGVDPVSGNEVPPGSLPEEVRDDIPAMLSEGEYIIPADVLRYYGMKFFEDLRAEAKIGLAGMEADGRIGGEPVAGPAMSEDLTPEEMAELDSLMMNVGGFVSQPTQSSMPDPYMQQQAMYNQNTPVARGNTGYNEGGQVEEGADDYLQPTFDPSQFQAGFSFLESSPTSTTPETDVRTVTLYSPEGGVTTVTLPAQQARYNALIALGYSEDPMALTTETAVGKAEERDGGDGSDASPSGPSISQMNGKQLMEAQQGVNQAMNTVANLPGILGVAFKGLSSLQQNAIDKRAKELGLVSVEDDTHGRNWAQQDDAGVRTAAAMTAKQVEQGIKYAERGDDRDTSWQGGEVAANQSAPDTDRSAEAAQADAQAAADALGVGMATGPR